VKKGVVRTLHDFFDRYVRGSAIALIHDDGFRRWSYTHDDVHRAAEAFAARLGDAGVQPGDRVAIWSENRPEWVIAFWGCLLRGVAVIPIDQRASPALAHRLVASGDPRGVLIGDGVPAAEWPTSLFVWRLHDFAQTGSGALPSPPAPARSGAGPARAPVTPDTVAEIVFTSGTTGDPKGVLITHRNILANITAIEPEATKYAPYLWPLQPLRFLSLLPLSHMFGQALTMFLPPLVRAGAVFVRGYNPDDIVRQIRRHRITLVVTVPRVLEMLRGRVQHLVPHCADPKPGDRSLPARLWRYRDAHRLFWWRFCGFVVGGAQLDEPLEEFWRRLGFAVIQGYGLTETAPIIAWNHPFKIKHGTVGKPLGDAEIRIAADGEILVRGAAVTSGYLNAAEKTREAFEGGWFHTGDVGSFDETGHLRIRGRKKDVIVASEGVKVFPEDVERVLDALPGVREAAIVGRRVNGAEHIHAVLVLGRGAEPAAVVRDANARLESHQHIQEFSVWPGTTLPRTEAIRKLKHHEIRRWVEAGATHPPESNQETGDTITRLVSRYARNRTLGPGTTLDEIGLTSLDRIELMTALEDEAAVALSEKDIGSVRTIGDLRRVVDTAEAGGRAQDAFPFPGWQRTRLARMIRDLSLPTWILPSARMFFRLRVEGREHLDAVRGPVIFAANHQSHFDIPVVLAALPGRWRRRVAAPTWKEYFDAHFFPERHTVLERLPNSAAYYLIALFFNAFPLPVTEPGMRQTLRYIGELASEGVSILIFPEGERTERGEIKLFQPGVGLMASKLQLPVIPIRLEGVDRVLHRTWNWPRRGTVSVAFGAPITLIGDDYAALARQVESAVVALRPLPDAGLAPVA
jgi:long-chain acyl-CoA synthetase